MRLRDTVSPTQQGFTWVFLIVGILFCVLIYFGDLCNLESGADAPWVAYKEAQGTQMGDESAAPEDDGNIGPIAKALIYNLDPKHERDWEIRRASVTRLGMMTPSSPEELGAITTHLKFHLDGRNERDSDIRTAVVEALSNLDTNWKKAQAGR